MKGYFDNLNSWIGVLALMAWAASPPAFAASVPDGFAAVNGTVTGGAGGPTVTITNATDFKFYVTQPGPYIVQVSGTINFGTVKPTSNKSIIGLGSDAAIVGELQVTGVSNLIVQNLFVSNDAGAGTGDGIRIYGGAHHIWIDHCTFVDTADGEVDITQASDFITVSWSKFTYTRNRGHNFANLIGADDGDVGDRGKLHVTFHHNWWSTLAIERMPRVRFGQAHLYNNYYSASGNNYCVGVGVESQILLENNYFDGVNNLWKDYSSGGNPGIIGWNAGNVFVNAAIPTWAPNSGVFTPPYPYEMHAGADVKALVMAGAGAGNGGEGPPPPPPSVPAAPTGLVATPGSAQVGLSWAATSGAASYNVKRATVSGGPYTVIATGVSATSYPDAGLVNGTTYYYVVSAVNEIGEGFDSAQASATPTTAGGAAPPAPTGLSGNVNNTSIVLKWQKSAGVTSYNVKRSTVNGGPFTVIATVTATTYTDSSVVKNTTYYYVVSALNAGVESPNSVQIGKKP